LVKKTEEILDKLVQGQRVESVPPELNMLFRPSAQPFLISWLRYDPTKEIAKLRCQVLIVQGTTDIQVSSQDAKALADANPKPTLLIIEGMNHVLKMVPKDGASQVSSYSDPTLPVSPALISAIIEFVNEATGQARSN
ncbi:MAG: alpha/beta hydrolase, partial [Pyrinomonadaceae bacterium]